MKNLKGALPPIKEDPWSSAVYFNNLGFILIILGLILSLGSFFYFLLAVSSGEYTSSEGRIYMTPQSFIFILVMSLVLLVIGMILTIISRRTGKTKDRKLSHEKLSIKTEKELNDE